MMRAVVVLVVVVGSLGQAWAQCALSTDAQYVTLQTDITVTNAGEFSAAVAAGDHPTIATAYNMVASPAYWVWKIKVLEEEYYDTTTVEGTTWSWTAFIGRSASEQNAWERMFTRRGWINVARRNVQQGILDIFSGAPGQTQRTHISNVSRELARRIEKLYAGGTELDGDPCTAATGSPCTRVFVGSITYRDVARALSMGTGNVVPCQ